MGCLKGKSACRDQRRDDPEIYPRAREKGYSDGKIERERI